MKILVAGDFCPQNRVVELFEIGDFATVLGEVKPIVEAADYSIVNFECAVTHGCEKPIEKIGPNLQCSKSGIEAVKWAGFDCVTLANNHFYDFGDEGVDNTLAACKEYGIDTVGGGKNLHEASKVLYKEIKGQTLAIINCCEHEFSIATDSTGGSNPLNPIQQYYAIKEAREKADYVLVIVHGGHEHYQLPSPRMQETYRFFVDAGADAVVNHHQHCYSGYEFYKEKPVIYGLGNFCFDEEGNPQSWCEGFMVIVEFMGDIRIRLVPYSQCNTSPSVKKIQDEKFFFNEIDRINGKILNGDLLEKSAISFFKENEKLTFYSFFASDFRFLRALQYRRIIPYFTKKKKILKILNCILCESNREKCVNNLSSL